MKGQGCDLYVSRRQMNNMDNQRCAHLLGRWMCIFHCSAVVLKGLTTAISGARLWL